MQYNCKEDIIQLTPQWKGERMPDGRPYVPDWVIEGMGKMTLEELWKPIYTKGYISQFQGDLRELHPGKKLIGRAVTAVMMPARPDLDETLTHIGVDLENRKGRYNQWVIDGLQVGDVLVVDMYDKIEKGTFIGGNLGTAIANRTKTGGAVIWGGVRDIEQMEQIKGLQALYRGVDPTPIRECVMTGYNTPCRIGRATCLPGDIVFCGGGGVLFVPAHLAEEVVTGAAKSHIKDIFGFEMLSQNKYTTAQIDRDYTKEMLDELTAYIRTHEELAEYAGLDWSEEYEIAHKNELGQCSIDTAL